MKFQSRFLLIAFFPILLTSCSDDDTQNVVLNETDIEGTWVVSEINSTPVVDLESNGNNDPNLMNQTTCFDGMSFNFDSNGNLTVVTTEITFDANSDPSFICSLRTDIGDYTISGNDLTVTVPISGNQETESVLVNIQNNILTFSLSQVEVAEFFNIPNGESFSAIDELEFVYVKI